MKECNICPLSKHPTIGFFNFRGIQHTFIDNHNKFTIEFKLYGDKQKNMNPHLGKEGKNVS